MCELGNSQSGFIRQERTQLMRPAFTLFEALLAIVLTTLIVVSLLSATMLYAQYRARGMEGARQTNVLVSTVSDLENDLRSCYSIGQAADSLSTQPVAGIMDQLQSSVAQERVLSFGAEVESPIRFVGREQAILLVRCGSNPYFQWTEYYPTAEQCQVLWLAPGVRSVRLPSALQSLRVQEREYQNPNDKNSKQLGLCRCTMPLLPSDRLQEASGGGSKSRQPSWDKNIEVAEARFRYFDGDNWRKEWDSHSEANRLPRAVEVQLTLAWSPSESMRIVIGMPR